MEPTKEQTQFQNRAMAAAMFAWAVEPIAEGVNGTHIIAILSSLSTVDCTPHERSALAGAAYDLLAERAKGIQ